MNIPDYVIERVRRMPPAGSCIVPGSTPVVAFGNARVARVATLGLNPSRVEFLDRAGYELAEARRRLETLRSLRVARLADAPEETIARVVAGCDGYFQRNPYWQWFRPLEQVLARLGASYSAGSACHLDLVQWATNPTWGGLSEGVRQRLIPIQNAKCKMQNTAQRVPIAYAGNRDAACSIPFGIIAEDAAFLQRQLSEEHITTLLLNGRGVVSTYTGAYQLGLKQVRVIADRTVRCEILAGTGPRGLHVIGWSTNLQSSFGVTRELRRMLAEAVAEIANQTC